MKRVALWVVFGCIFGVLAGCSSSNKPLVGLDGSSDNSQSSSSEPGKPPSTDSGSTPSAQPKTDSTAKAPEKVGDGTVVPAPKNSVLSDKRIDPVTPRGTAGWGVSDLTASTIGANVGLAMKNLKNTLGQALCDVDTPEGSGRYRLQYEIGGDGKIRMTYISTDVIPQDVIVISNGKWRNRISGKGMEKPVLASAPSPDTKLDQETLARQFAREYGRIMFLGIAESKDAWKPLLEGLSNGKGGYEATVERRSMIVNNRPFLNYRIIAKRKAEFVKTLGQSTFEVIVDGNLWLPVTVRSQSVTPKGETWKHEWSVRWEFNKTIDDEQFKVIQG